MSSCVCRLNEELWSNVGSWHEEATSRNGQCRVLYRRSDCYIDYNRRYTLYRRYVDYIDDLIVI